MSEPPEPNNVNTTISIVVPRCSLQHSPYRRGPRRSACRASLQACYWERPQNHPSFQLFPIHLIMATFYANPNETDEPWIERAAFNGFRNWHVMFFCFSGLTTLIILICCCVKLRIPRTKQEIEGDYRRKKLAEKFQERLRMIQNQDMDVMDLQQALRLIQEDFDQENAKIQEKVNLVLNEQSNGEPQQPKCAKKFADIMLAAKMQSHSTD